jgi:hypothetical protein
MLSAIRMRITYVNVVATLVLVFAMTGGALAAKKYLITSTKQISPSVLKALQGKAGPAGANGAQGSAGPQGPVGAQGAAGTAGAKGETGPAGKEGPAGKVGATGPEGEQGEAGQPWTAGGNLPKGSTETGVWSGVIASAGEAAQGIPISFTLPLPAAPEVILVNEGETSKAGCPGVVSGVPTASEGKLCLYKGVGPGYTQNSVSLEFAGSSFAPTRSGAFIQAACEGLCAWQGVWAVTAK